MTPLEKTILRALRIKDHRYYSDFACYWRDPDSFDVAEANLIKAGYIRTNADGGMLELTQEGILKAGELEE